MINYYFRTVKDETIKELGEPRTGVWVHVVDPNEEDMAKLVELFKLDGDIVKDATDFYEVPRMEKSEGATYYFTRYPYNDQQQGNATAPILIIVGETFVMTIALRDVPQFRKFISGERPVFTTQKAKFFIQIMSIFTRSFDRELRRFQKAVNKDRIRLRSIGPKDIERLVGYETKLNGMVDALIPTNIWLQKVTNTGGQIQMYSEDVEMMEDLVIANGQVVNSARSVLTTIQNIRGAIEAIMTSRLNNALRVLTVLTILLTVPLVIASLYGMNVALPLQDNPYAFFVILTFSVVLLLSLVAFFRKNDWL
ncbi:MAG: magnesium/nickel/cobalt transporter CorA [Parcubacteria bacterium OLB19]|nr:MAG: magnesium/nickel/cobalt transporter CorA [Parcubacteria bacterium OLB19]